MSPDNKFTKQPEQKQKIPRAEWQEIVNSCSDLSWHASLVLADMMGVFAAVAANRHDFYTDRLNQLRERNCKDDLIVRWLADAFMHIADDGTNMQLSRVASDIFDALDNEDGTK